MAFCSNCGKEITGDGKFCSGCGVAVEVPNKSEKEQRKTIYDGDLHKCPKCGAHLNAFETICPVCNYELRGVQATSCVHELALKLEKTDSEDQKIELIRNFYIPNTKEDIYEFFILAYSNITAGSYGIDAWTVKLEQAYLKSRLAFGNSEEFWYIKELYESVGKVSRKKRTASTKAYKGAVLMIAGALVAIIICLFNLLNDNTVPILVLGIVSFIVGLVLFVLPEKKKK